MSKIFVLLVAYQLKHFLADYPLQTRYMLGKFRPGWDFVRPLFAHVLVHGLFTAAIAGTVLLADRHCVLKANLLALFDMSIHFAMDRIKASPRYLGRYKTLTGDTAPTATEEQWRSSDRFWWSVGVDQMVHHLTHYAIIYYLVMR